MKLTSELFTVILCEPNFLTMKDKIHSLGSSMIKKPSVLIEGGGGVCFSVSRHGSKKTHKSKTIDQRMVKVYIFEKL